MPFLWTHYTRPSNSSATINFCNLEFYHIYKKTSYVTHPFPDGPYLSEFLNRRETIATIGFHTIVHDTMIYIVTGCETACDDIENWISEKIKITKPIFFASEKANSSLLYRCVLFFLGPWSKSYQKMVEKCNMTFGILSVNQFHNKCSARVIVLALHIIIKLLTALWVKLILPKNKSIPIQTYQNIN